MIEISAIISTYNRAHFLEGLFESILNQNIDKNRYEIVIVNNNCTDNTEGLCNKFIKENPDLNIFYCIETNQGLSYGRNRGIKESKGEIVTFLDDDAVITENFFEETLNFFKKKSHVNAIGGKILLKYMEKKPNWYNPFLASLLGYYNYGDQEKVFTTSYFRGSNMSFRRSLFDKFEAFNTNLGRVGKQLYGNEEKELFYRLKEGGEEMWYVPSTVVLHLVPIERTYSDFIKRQALGTGKSQRDQALIKGKTTYLKALVAEGMKWIASFSLFFAYLVILKPAVAVMLIRFRAWVTLGMLRKNNN